LRAKIDPANDNGCLRDPSLYRCLGEPHARTGDKFKLYPLYDFACPIVDSLEGVTHALRSSEYHDRNPQYDWVQNAAGVPRVKINDFSRLNFTYTVLSKRKLNWFVEKKIVDQWDDPRFPTIQGLLRRGLSVTALKEFIVEQGASKTINLMDITKLWAINRGKIEQIIRRFTAVEKTGAVAVHLTGAPEHPEYCSYPFHKKNDSLGKKIVTRFKTILLEAGDAKNLKPEGEEVTLMYWGNAVLKDISKDQEGKITSIKGDLNLNGSVKLTTWKLTWLPDIKEELVNVKLVFFGHLISKPKLEKEDKLENFVNLESKKEVEAWGDPALRLVKKGEQIQLERKGYWICDELPKLPGEPIVLFQIPDGHVEQKK